MNDEGLCEDTENEAKQFHCYAQQCAFDFCIYKRDLWIDEKISGEQWRELSNYDQPDGTNKWLDLYVYSFWMMNQPAEQWLRCNEAQ